MNHIHISGLEFTKFVLMFIVFAVVWRMVEARLHETRLGQAMSFIM